MTENKKPENVSAFPALHLNGHEGMTLRDYFAAKAMQADISIPRLVTLEEKHIRSIAKTSYQIADAMLKQREL